MHTLSSRFVCFNTDLEQSPEEPFDISCTPIAGPEGDIEPLGMELYKILSPDFVEEEYPNNHLCRYSFPECPEGYVQQLFWSEDDFQLQDSFEGTTYCLDYVQLFLSSFDLPRGGARLDTISSPDQVLCGSQGIFHVEINTNEAIPVRHSLGGVGRGWR